MIPAKSLLLAGTSGYPGRNATLTKITCIFFFRAAFKAIFVFFNRILCLSSENARKMSVSQTHHRSASLNAQKHSAKIHIK
jgi:hypothetical protein